MVALGARVEMDQPLPLVLSKSLRMSAKRTPAPGPLMHITPAPGRRRHAVPA